MSAGASGDRDGRRPALPADRLAELRRERADRLARLRGAPDAAVARAGSTGTQSPARDVASGTAPSDVAPGAEPALAAFLRALRAAIEEAPPAAQAQAAARGGFPVAAVLPFQRAPDRLAERAADRAVDNRAADLSTSPAAGDLDRLPGIGPGLVWALERAGIARLSDLAVSAPVPLADRLGPIGGLVDLPGWIAFARSATETGAPAA